jgi:hypothetical protein
MSQEIGYCGLNAVKDRLLIATDDTSYNDSLSVAICEASRLVDIFLKPYTTVPLAENDVTSEISIITADFAASIFKRRMLPDEVKIQGSLQPDQMNEMNAQGWFAQGIRKIEQYIKSYYTLAQSPIDISGTPPINQIHNPELYLVLFEKGIITGKEARMYMANAYANAIKRVEEITRTEVITKTETHRQYATKKQSSFAFISSDENDGYKEDSEYEPEPGGE